MAATRRPGERMADAFGDLVLRADRAAPLDQVIAGRPGVDRATYPVLIGVARLGAPTATELAGHIGLDRTVTTRHATRLETAGLLARRPHPNDARATTLTLTARGRRAVATMRARLVDLMDSATAGWSAAERRAFAAAFEDFAQRLGSDADS